jgi:hypothetical protein
MSQDRERTETESLWADVQRLNAALLNQEALQAMVKEEEFLCERLEGLVTMLEGTRQDYRKGEATLLHTREAALVTLKEMTSKCVAEAKEPIHTLNNTIMTTTATNSGNVSGSAPLIGSSSGLGEGMSLEELDSRVQELKNGIAHWMSERDQAAKFRDSIAQELEGLREELVAERNDQDLRRRGIIARDTKTMDEAEEAFLLDEEIAQYDALCLSLTKILSIPKGANLGQPIM